MSKQNLIQANTEFSYDALNRLQLLPLEQKILMTQRLIKQFYEAMDGKAYLSFSGGKDSTVLLDICQKLYPDMVAVFIDTGLEYPEIRDFVKTIKNVEWIKPKLTFRQVVDKYGFPLPSKEISEAIYEYRTSKSQKLRDMRFKKIKGKWSFLIDAPFKISNKCCHALKKSPAKIYEHKTGLHPIIGTMASESILRKNAYARHGCNIYSGNRPHSNPLSFWTEKDIWEYIGKYNVAYSEIYKKGYDRTGCMFCLFGVFSEKKGATRFDKMKVTHPKLWDYCMNSIGLRTVLDFCSDNMKKKEDPGLF